MVWFSGVQRSKALARTIFTQPPPNKHYTNLQRLYDDTFAAPTPGRCHSVYIFVKASELHISAPTNETCKLKDAVEVGNEMNL